MPMAHADQRKVSMETYAKTEKYRFELHTTDLGNGCK